MSPTHLHYLIRNQSNLIYYFYVNDEKKLFFSSYDQQLNLIENKALVSEPIIEFGVTVDEDDVVHLIYIDSSGNLTYMIKRDFSYSSKTLGKLDIQSNTYRYLTIHVQKGFTHLLCLKQNILNSMIVSLEHTFWDSGKPKKHTVTSYMPGKYPSPFFFDVDSLGNFHIVYKVLHKGNHQLYYYKFSENSQKWTSREHISNILEDHSHPSMLIDKKDTLHLVWTSVVDNNLVLKYRQKKHIINFKSTWSDVINLTDKNCNCILPVFLEDEDNIKIYYKQNKSILSLVTDNQGLSWSETNTSPKLENPILYRYKSCVNQEGRWKANYLYGEENYPFSLCPFNKSYKSSKTATDKTTQLNINKNNNNEIEMTTSSDNNLSHDNKENINLRIESIVDDIECYINDMQEQINKLKKIKASITNDPTDESFISYSKTVDRLVFALENLNTQYANIESEQADLKNNLSSYCKKIDIFDNKLVDLKKQYLIIENDINNILKEESGFFNKVLKYFKN
ncbi:hypothetical protein RH915_01180 [Serpentinicella sp. ANB-PHB4]|uniref:hypothetical protein n=1 Tax=Serpentinicella sp. ANB-PHB4 TaxID=3074076 RepID=UPI00285E3946|nr:hypothetical protein [Serpentinicella sp. ANB-PHB4]MDR5658091.1 hypothetical protein [Serpentinicella sp. ANB-PHB4]